MNKKWFIILAAVGIHISIGSVYAWSVFTTPIMEYFGCSLGAVQFAFSLAILFLGFSASFLGKYVEKYGSKKAGLISTFCYTVGLLGTGLAIHMKSIPLLYLFYGMIGGIGLGVGYITPVSTTVKWFPNNRGFATGCAIMGFGFAAFIASPVIQKLIDTIPLPLVPVVLALVYCVIMTASSLTFSLPPVEEGSAEKTIMTSGYTAKEAVKTWQFPALWTLFFINIFCGIAIVSIASPMAQEMAGMTAAQAAAMVGIVGLFNGAGRIAWSSFSDYFGRANTYILFFVIEILGYYLLVSLTGSPFVAMVYLLVTCYGGGFSCMPAYLSDIFGVKQLSMIHGHILTAWGIAGLLSPMFIAYCKEAFGGYTVALYTFAGMFVIALALALLLRLKSRFDYAPKKKPVTEK